MQRTGNINDDSMVLEILEQGEYGVLALAGEKPYAVPVNFIYYEKCLWVHGSKNGKKMSIINKNHNVSFNIATEVNLIPSYFSNANEMACSASSFFKSIIVDGQAEIIDDPLIKRNVLTEFMRKYQPEGKYQALTQDEYSGNIKATALIKINIVALSAKFKFGQTLSDERFQMILEHLANRGLDKDISTMQTMTSMR